MYKRPKGEVPFPANSWLKQYRDSHKWHSITTKDALGFIERKFGDEKDRMVRNAVVGGMSLNFDYFDLLYTKEPIYQDELPYNNELINKGIYPKWF